MENNCNNNSSPRYGTKWINPNWTDEKYKREREFKWSFNLPWNARRGSYLDLVNFNFVSAEENVYFQTSRTRNCYYRYIYIYTSLYCPFLVSFSLFFLFPLLLVPLKTKLSFTFVQNLLACFAIRPSRSLHADAALQRYPNLISRSWNSSRRTVASSSKMKKGNRKKKRNDRRVSQRHCYRRYIFNFPLLRLER